jgi:hypothetical protein
MHIALLVDLGSDILAHDADARLPALERCLARGDPMAVRSPRFHECLLADHGVSVEDAPIAALSLAGEGDVPGADYWLRADPVSLQPTLHRLAGRALHPGELDWDEAHARAALIAPHLQEDGCELRVKDPLRWYVRCPPQRMRTHPLPSTSLPLEEDLLPSGPDAPYWQRTMTEAQMLLYASGLDDARAVEGRPPVNGIWCWGGGRIETPPVRRYTDVISDDVLALGLARLSGAGATPLPGDASAAIGLGDSTSNREVLVAISAQAALSLPAFDSAWLAPMLAWVADGTAERIDLRLLLGDRPIGRSITRKALRRWWRRTRPLHAHA